MIRSNKYYILVYILNISDLKFDYFNANINFRIWNYMDKLVILVKLLYFKKMLNFQTNI